MLDKIHILGQFSFPTKDMLIFSQRQILAMNCFQLGTGMTWGQVDGAGTTWDQMEWKSHHQHHAVNITPQFLCIFSVIFSEMMVLLNILAFLNNEEILT